MIPVLDELKLEFDSIRDVDVKRAERQMPKVEEGDVALGVVHSEAARRVWALAFVFSCRASQCMVDGRRADSHDEEQEAHQAAHRWANMERAARDLFFLQAKTDIGGSAWSCSSITLREGWLLVQITEQPSAIGALIKADLLRQLGHTPDEEME